MRKNLLQILVCPECRNNQWKSKITKYDKHEVINGELQCTHCKLVYSILEGIPLMVTEHQFVQSDVYFNKTEDLKKHFEVRDANLKYHNEAADLYEKDISAGQFSQFNQSRIENIIKDISRGTSTDFFLDLACGTGNVLKFGKKYFHTAVGVDISVNMLRIAKSRKLEVIQADAVRLPFASNTFGAISCFSVLHHVYDQFPIFKEIHRVLKKGGILYTDWDPLKRESLEKIGLRYQLYFLLRYFYRKMKLLYRQIYPRKLFSEAPMDTCNFREICPQTKEIYKLAEYHHPSNGLGKDGIDFEVMRNYLLGFGFTDIRDFYHWNGKKFFDLPIYWRVRVRVLQLFGYYPIPFAENIMILAKKE